MKDSEQEFSRKNFFVPLTTFKAIHIIVILGIIVYFNCLINGFVWDDKTFITLNPDIHSFDYFKLIRPNLFNNTDLGQYRPIPALYFSLLYSVFSETTFFYHVFQVLLHIVNSILVFLFFKKFFQEKLSLFFSLLFLIHPMQVESVSYIASSGNPLFFLFGMIALLLSTKDFLSIKRFIYISVLLLFSCLTNEGGFLFLIIILLYRFLFNKKQIAVFISGFLLTTLLYFSIRFGIGNVYFTNIGTVPISRLPLIDRLLNIPAIFIYYLKTFIFPIHLSVQQYWVNTKITFTSFYLPLLLMGLFFLLSSIVIINLKKQKKKKEIKIFLFFSAWFFLGIFLHLQIFPLDMTVADRWFYFPMVGLLGMLAVSLYAMKRINKNVKDLLWITAIIVILILSVRTMVRNTNWSDALTLYIHDQKTNDNYILEDSIGYEYLHEQNYDKALQYYLKSLAMDPNDTNYYNVGSVYEASGNIPKAKEYYFKGLKAANYYAPGHKHFVLLYEKLAYILFRYDKPEVTKNFIAQALQDYPRDGSLWASLAICEYKLHHQTEALFAAGKAKTLLPSDQNLYLYDQILNSKPIDLNM